MVWGQLWASAVLWLQLSQGSWIQWVPKSLSFFSKRAASAKTHCAHVPGLQKKSSECCLSCWVLHPSTGACFSLPARGRASKSWGETLKGALPQSPTKVPACTRVRGWRFDFFSASDAGAAALRLFYPLKEHSVSASGESKREILHHDNYLSKK